MLNILPQARALVTVLMSLMPSVYQRDSLQALLCLFLTATGKPLPTYCTQKSEAALSRFLNRYPWPTTKVIRAVRQAAVQAILAHRRRGKPPVLQVILDATCLEKTGKFKAFQSLIRVFDRRRGLHLVVLFLVIGQFRLPWSFRVYRGKGHPSIATLGTRLLGTVPRQLSDRFRVRVLADTTFGTAELLSAVRRRGWHAIVGVRCDRKLANGRRLYSVPRRGMRVQLEQMPLPLWVSWVWLKRDDGKLVLRYAASTEALHGQVIAQWGKKRWVIEGFFQAGKYRFGLDKFGQQTLLGVYRWLVLSLVAYVLAWWGHLSQGGLERIADWGGAARKALQELFPLALLAELQIAIRNLQPVLDSLGAEVRICWCKI
jgi:hypothetical protein